jgi:hypothetical protein
MVVKTAAGGVCASINPKNEKQKRMPTINERNIAVLLILASQGLSDDVQNVGGRRKGCQG